MSKKHRFTGQIVSQKWVTSPVTNKICKNYADAPNKLFLGNFFSKNLDLFYWYIYLGFPHTKINKSNKISLVIWLLSLLSERVSKPLISIITIPPPIVKWSPPFVEGTVQRMFGTSDQPSPRYLDQWCQPWQGSKWHFGKPSPRQMFQWCQSWRGSK